MPGKAPTAQATTTGPRKQPAQEPVQQYGLEVVGDCLSQDAEPAGEASEKGDSPIFVERKLRQSPVRQEGECDTVDWVLLCAIVFLSGVTLMLLLPMVPQWYMAVVSVHKWPWWAWLMVGVATGVGSLWLRIRQEQ